jgi:ATP-dependent DNA ligase
MSAPEAPGDGALVFAHACKLGAEGIVSKAARVALQIGPIAGLAEV